MQTRQDRPYATLWRRGWRTAATVAAAGALTLPAAALAASVDSKIPDGPYATVEEAHVPTGVVINFTLHKHSYLSGLALGCTPDAADATLIADSGESQIANSATKKKIALERDGDFSYDGPAKVTADGAGEPKVATSTLDVKGRYVPHGKVYHYLGSLQNKVTATLIFEGTASSPGCIDLPKGHKFYLYETVSSGGV